LRISDCSNADIAVQACTNVSVSNSTDITVAIQGNEASRNVSISGCSMTRRPEGSGAYLNIDSVEGCVVSGNVFDTSNTTCYAVGIGGRPPGVSDVVFQGNLLRRSSGGAELVHIAAGESPTNVVIANNVFRVATGGAIFRAFSGANVSIHHNQFFCSECPNPLTAISIRAETGPWRIESNVESSNASGGKWQLAAPNMALLNNAIAQGFEGSPQRNEGNTIQ
jgi:hypothetical protein